MSLSVSFLSDFGLDDEFVGVVHGVIARIAPDVRILDVTHRIPAGDVRGGSLALMRSVQYMPRGVALAVVDPGVGTDRKAIACQTEWGYFVGPDNGLLSPAVAITGGATKTVAIENPELILPSPGATFDGRDRFGPAAAVLASGQASIDDLGPELDQDALVPMLLPLTERFDDRVVGEAWWIDGFGNVQTNVSPEELISIGLALDSDLSIVIGSTTHTIPWRGAYGEVESGAALVHVDSWGMMSVAVRDGRADQALDIRQGTPVGFRVS